jgi:hypothetical protein
MFNKRLKTVYYEAGCLTAIQILEIKYSFNANVYPNSIDARAV